MHLVDDIDGVFTYLRRDTNLVDEVSDVIYRVIRSRIEFVDIKRPLFIEGLARLAFIACIETILGIRAVDGLREDTCAGGLTYSSRSAEQVRMRQAVLTDGVLQGLRERLLTHHGLKGLWPVLTR